MQIICMFLLEMPKSTTGTIRTSCKMKLFWNPTLCDIGQMVDGWGQLEIMISGGEMKFGRGLGDGLGMSAGPYCSLRGWTLDIYHITPIILLSTLLSWIGAKVGQHGVKCLLQGRSLDENLG